MNLSPDFPIPAEDLHTDLAFPSGAHVRRLLKAQMELGIQPIPASEFLKLDRAKLRRPSELWPILDKAWSLHSRGRVDLAQAKIDDYFDEPGTNKRLSDAIFDFCMRMLAPARFSLFKDAASFAADTNSNHGDKFSEFIGHLKGDVSKGNLERFHETFKEYFACYSDFSQTLSYATHGLDVPGNHEASSSAFHKTKLFYGNAYENLTTNVATLACLNNVAAGRSFNEFLTTDLKSYMTFNKAKRCNPFQEVEPLMNIGKCLESTIRNASHHGAMRLINNGRTIQYRSGGNGAHKTMTYLDYVGACNEIMLSTCALLALELLLLHNA